MLARPLSGAAFRVHFAARSVRRRTFATVQNGFSSFAPSDSSASSGPATLHLKSGVAFTGKQFGANTNFAGETVFSTSITSYTESMTDPSYRGQILVFTQPLIGNYGVPSDSRDKWGLCTMESDRIQPGAIIVADLAWRYSHWMAVESLAEWCARHNVPGITGVDTRALTQILRDGGSTLGQVRVGDNHSQTPESNSYVDPNIRNLVGDVSTKKSYTVNPQGKFHVALIDLGTKHHIIRSLITRGAKVTVVPWDYDLSQDHEQYDGIFLSNGPGNPVHLQDTVQNLRKLFKVYTKPIFGICMGNLLVGQAAGLQTKKLKYGNRGHNVPCINMDTGECVISSQNHGYALDDGDGKMPSGWKTWFRNANDGSCEGIRHVSRPIMSCQFHPEAAGGPQDTGHLFDSFVAGVVAAKKGLDGKRIHDGVLEAARVPEPTADSPVV